MLKITKENKEFIFNFFKLRNNKIYLGRLWKFSTKNASLNHNFKFQSIISKFNYFKKNFYNFI